jgi:multimeric flavodoxin WrbA
MTSEKQVHIIALNGSPKKNGNTATAMSWVLDGCQETGARVEWIHLVDYNIQYCQGCHTCIRSRECPIDDDFLKIRDRLIDCDGIIVGSPVYSGDPTAILKTLMDRLTLLLLYIDLFDKQLSVGVTTSGIAPTKKLAKKIGSHFGHIVGIIGIKTASLKHGYTALRDISFHKKMEEARKLGKKLVLKIQSNSRPHAFFYTWINFLRKHLLSRVLKNNPDQFARVIPIWQEKGWLKIKNE